MIRKLGKVCAVCLALVCLCIGALTGCNRVSDGNYRLYTYDTIQSKFIDLQVEMHLGAKAGGYELTYFDTVHMMGTAQKTPSGYLLQCDNNVFVQVQNALSRLVGEEPVFDEESKAAWQQAVVAETQLFCYGDYLFSSGSVDLIRRIRPQENKTSYTSLDGYYESAENTDSVYLFKDGKVYTTQQDDKGNYQKDEDGEPLLYTYPDAIYTLANGLIVLTRVDQKGELKLTDGKPDSIVYLMAAITYPADLDEMVYTDDSYSQVVKDLATQLKGKSVGVLTKTFYSTRPMDTVRFD